ncbi:MAG TPA: hypothetical protein PLU33_11785 [Treponemataceae bacterium]|nr:hypothetical protein [Treponemataceae bacterium]HQL05813.1 hypothetical protein [Treponemataceae bacterium]
MAVFYVDKNELSNGYHEIHEADCDKVPEYAHRLLLGTFHDCFDALIASKKIYPKSKGCHECCKECSPPE